MATEMSSDDGDSGSRGGSGSRSNSGSRDASGSRGVSQGSDESESIDSDDVSIPGVYNAQQYCTRFHIVNVNQTCV